MPRGFYIKSSSDKLNIGDIVIFNLGNKTNNFVKYIAAYEGDTLSWANFQG
jgi:hypothetical protein